MNFTFSLAILILKKSPKNIFDSIKNKDEHFGFCPKKFSQSWNAHDDIS